MKRKQRPGNMSLNNTAKCSPLSEDIRIAIELNNKTNENMVTAVKFTGAL